MRIAVYIHESNFRNEESMPLRNGEDKAPLFRSDRCCQINGQWYFVTREKTKEGPYANRAEADAGVRQYIENLQSQAAAPPQA
jgi:Domain of unknown function (DUF6316)